MSLKLRKVELTGVDVYEVVDAYNENCILFDVGREHDSGELTIGFRSGQHPYKEVLDLIEEARSKLALDHHTKEAFE